MPKPAAEQFPRRLRVAQGRGRLAFGQRQPGAREQGDGEVHRAGWRVLGQRERFAGGREVAAFEVNLHAKAP